MMQNYIGLLRCEMEKSRYRWYKSWELEIASLLLFYFMFN